MIEIVGKEREATTTEAGMKNSYIYRYQVTFTAAACPSGKVILESQISTTLLLRWHTITAFLLVSCCIKSPKFVGGEESDFETLIRLLIDFNVQ